MIRLVLAMLLLASPLRAATDIVEYQSPGGITFWMVEEPSIPILSIEIAFRGGTSLDPVGKEGATYLMAGLLEEGAGDLDAQGFKRAEETLAARFDYDAFRDSVSISAEMLVENAEATVDLLRLALTDPSFDPVAVARVRDQVLSGLASDQTDPDEIARLTFRAMSFPGHPYGTPDEGSIETVSALTAADVAAAHRAALVTSRMKVGVVGAMDPAEVGLLLDRLLGDLPSDGPALPPETAMAAAGGIEILPLDVPQSVAVFGHVGLERDHPDYLIAYVVNEIFGAGGLGSRLSDEVREKRGLTYGVYAGLAPFDHAAQVIGSVSSANDRIAEAIDVIRAEWRRIAEEGVTAEELERIKLYLTGSYPLRFDSNMKIAGNLVGMQSVGLPIDYVKVRNDLVNAVTLEDVNRVAADLYRAEELFFVVVGEPQGLTE